MKYTHLTVNLLIAAFLTFAGIVTAQDAPHDFGCQPCHRPPIQSSTDAMSAKGSVLICLSCHNPTGQASETSIGFNEIADPWEEHTGSTHAFNVYPDNPDAGAETPTTPEMAENLLGKQIVCSTCHEQHYQAPRPFLRTSNSADQMCLDCHRSRDLGTWASDPINNIGSHPVRVEIPLASEAYQTPSDNGPYLPMKAGMVSCSTCHAVHFENSVDSRQFHAILGTTESASFSNPGWTPGQWVGWGVRFPDATANRWQHRFVVSNTADTLVWNDALPTPIGAGNIVVLNSPGIGDGTLVRGEASDKLCLSCHTYENHGPSDNVHATCVDCHTPHGTSNILLVDNNLNGKTVSFNGQAPSDFVHGAPNYDGVCEACHTSTAYHRSDASGNHDHYKDYVCTECHLHENGFTPDCGSCHGATPETIDSGSHPAHFQLDRGPKMQSCDECHGPGAAVGVHAGHQNGSVEFSGQNLAETSACDECHSPQGFVNGVTIAKSAWDTGVYETDVQLYPSYEDWCSSCHDDDPATIPGNESSSIYGRQAPSIMGDNSSYGYYVTGHGRSSRRFQPMSWQAPTDPGNPAASVECNWCHDMQSQHLDNANTRLRPGYEIDQANTGCNQCHALGGAAAALPEYYAWSESYEHSSHGNRLCSDCHNPHGTAGPNPAMATGSEEGLCLTCHPTTEAEFARAHGHDVDASAQGANGSRVECTMCHNPHLATEEQPLADPDSLATAWTDASPRDFCLACHDDAPPRAVRFPASSPGTGWDQTHYRDSRHDEYLGGDCTTCHNAHASDNSAALLAAYSTSPIRPAGQTVADSYALCFLCHDYTKTVTDNNAFSEYHKKHVVEEDAPCINCHGAHGGYDAGESGLINFEYPTAHGFNMSLQAGGQSYTLSTAFEDTGTNRGACYLTCHGESHDPERYSGLASVTVNCLLCHETQP